MIRFFVAGRPKTKGSFTPVVNKKTGKAFLLRGQQSKDWESRVAYHAQQAHSGELIDGPVDLELTFYLSRPKCHYGSGRNACVLKLSAPRYPDKRPDTGKLSRAVEDSLTGTIYHDDGQVVDESIRKRYAELGQPAGVDVTVKEIE